MSLAEFSELLYVLAPLAAPFGMGIICGSELQKRLPKAPEAPSLEHRFGAMVSAMIVDVVDQRKWVEPGSGVEISKSIDVPVDGRKIEVIVREIA